MNNTTILIDYLENNKNICENITITVFYKFFSNNFLLFILSYPSIPNDVIKKKMYDFIMNIPVLIPINKISLFTEDYINDNPVTPYLDNRKSLMRWGYKFLEALRRYIYNIKEMDNELHLNYYELWNKFINKFYREDKNENEYNNDVSLYIEKKYGININKKTKKNYIIKVFEIIKSQYRKYKHKFSILFLLICFSFILYIMYIQNEN